MTQPANVPITVHLGTHNGTLRFTVRVTDGSAFNLTGYTPRATVARVRGGPILADLGAVLYSAAAGQFDVELTPVVLAPLIASTYFWTVYLEDASDVPQSPLAVGNFIVLGVTLI